MLTGAQNDTAIDVIGTKTLGASFGMTCLLILQRPPEQEETMYDYICFTDEVMKDLQHKKVT